MRPRRHMKILFVVSAAWLLFWVGGLPDYYRQYSAGVMIAFDAVILPPLIAIIYSVLKRTSRGHAVSLSLWFAFYMTVPLFFYDLIYCGYYRGYGASFIWVYWYLTVYYILPWLLFPFVGWLIERRRERKAVLDGPR